MASWLCYALLLGLSVAALASTLAGLPGLWLMVAGFAGYGVVTGWGTPVGGGAVALVAGLALLAEVVEFFAGAAGGKAFGGGKRAMVGALAGGLLGALAGTWVLPVPVAGTVVGALAGAFAGASLVEWAVGRDLKRAARVGVGAAVGRAAGMAVKLAVGVVMLVVVAVAGWPRPVG